MFFADNLKMLRKRKKKSQEDVAELLGVKRSSLSGYENGSSQPPYKTLLKISDYFQIGLDRLLRTDLGALRESQLVALENGGDLDLSGRKLRVLATTMDAQERENIEMVPVKAKAGYTGGYDDPDYIGELPRFQLPFLDRNRKYRAFQITGDSMPPLEQGDWVTGEYVQDWQAIKNGQPYIIVTEHDGVVFKMVYNKIEESGQLMLCSTNPMYEPYMISVRQVLEVWKFVNYISSELPDPQLSRDDLTKSVLKLQQEVSALKLNTSTVVS